jgi:carbonic anhydrase
MDVTGTRDMIMELGFTQPAEAPPIDITRKGAKIFVLSCIDPRFNERLAYFLINEKEVHSDYDLVSLAGASLGVSQEEYSCWHCMFYDTLNIAIALHNIKEVWVFDHLDCGMYKVTLGLDTDLDPTIHITYLQKLRNELSTLYPYLGFKGFIMMTDGSIKQTDN